MIPSASEPPPRRWPPLQRVAFRFTFAYVLFYYPVLAVDRLPGFGGVIDRWNGAWSCVVTWSARNVFHVTADFPDTSSGLLDVTFSYVRLGCVVVFALLSTLVWSALDRRHAYERRLNDGMRVVLRYGLASAMLTYGLSKVFPSQFGPVPLERLLEPLGARSRMGLLWTFMGESVPYTIFCGAAECIAGLLLLSRRTAPLGAFVTIGVMANVVALDFSYGVFVKLFAAHLLAMAVLVAAPDFAVVWRVLVLHRATHGRTFAPYFANAHASRATRVLKAVFVTYLIGATARVELDSFRTSRAQLPPSRLEGIWEVDSFARNGEDVPPLATDDARWRRLVIDRSGKDVFTSDATLWTMTDARKRFGATEDAEHRTVTLAGRDSEPLVFDCQRSDADHLALHGEVSGASLAIALHRVDMRSLRLPAETFHWANDHPFSPL